ncbi:flagellar hook-length control protein FliK [Vibrio alfacsensis]|uniref:flagellar hook-length control protein FliK n=1 Tax=Vibrio alfacsensis TaxID=1074311 RepID=UPI0040677820
MLVNAMKLPSSLASFEASTQQGSVAPAHGFNEQSTTGSLNLQSVFDSLVQSFGNAEPQNPQSEQPLDLSLPLESSLPIEGAQTTPNLEAEMARGIQLDTQSAQHVASFGRSTALHNDHRIGRDLSSSMTVHTNGATVRDSVAGNHPTTSIPVTPSAMAGIETTSVPTSSNQTSVVIQALPTQAPAIQTMVSEVTPNLPSTTESAAATKPEWAPVRVDTSSSKWGEQMMQVLHDRVTLQAQQNVQEAKIRLDPPDLGKLDVLVRVEGDRLSVQINASATLTREALMQISERLRAELQEQNFVHVDVNIGSEQGQERHNHDHQEDENTIFAAREPSESQSNTTNYSEHWLNTQA